VNAHSPFQPEDLVDLDTMLLDRALSVMTMQEVCDGMTWPQVIGMRHDVDNVIEPAVRFAEWEATRGYRSTYYILHTAQYWKDKTLLRTSLEIIAGYGHEIGIHNNALSEALVSGGDPRALLAQAIGELREYGFEINGTVAHGDRLCYDGRGKVRFVNDEMFSECPRPEIGEPDREIGVLKLKPVSLEEFGLEYDANWLGRDAYLSDSGGAWSSPGFDEVARRFPYQGQLHMLVHPDWWGKAFVGQRAAA
jgi:hypothetical protein